VSKIISDYLRTKRRGSNLWRSVKQHECLPLAVIALRVHAADKIILTDGFSLSQLESPNHKERNVKRHMMNDRRNWWLLIWTKDVNQITSDPFPFTTLYTIYPTKNHLSSL